jgi:hypothetical protein
MIIFGSVYCYSMLNMIISWYILPKRVKIIFGVNSFATVAIGVYQIVSMMIYSTSLLVETLFFSFLAQAMLLVILYTIIEIKRIED